jgi:hypothetical protein
LELCWTKVPRKVCKVARPYFRDQEKHMIAVHPEEL